jgi:hypothetical protein
MEMSRDESWESCGCDGMWTGGPYRWCSCPIGAPLVATLVAPWYPTAYPQIRDEAGVAQQFHRNQPEPSRSHGRPTSGLVMKSSSATRQSPSSRRR